LNRSVLARIGPALFAFYLLAYAAFFAWGLVRFSNETWLPIFTMEVTALQAFRDLLAWIVPITAGAVVTALSLAVGSAKRGGPALPFNQLVASTVVTFLVLAAGFTALSETVGTNGARRLDELAWHSRLAREYEKLAGKARGLQDWSRATEYDRLYLRIDPQNATVEEYRYADEAKASREQTGTRPAAAPAAKADDGVDAGSLVKKAQAYFDDEDWYSALWYARQAETIDPRRADATRLAARALEQIEAAPPSAAATADRTYAATKKAAFEVLNRGDVVGAYYAFASLAARRPDDVDAKEFLGIAEKALRTKQFFTDDAATAASLPGLGHLLWFAEGADSVAMWADRMVSIEREDGTERWLFDVEAVKIDAQGVVAWHLAAASARLSDDEKTLLLRGVDRGDPKKGSGPVYLAGTRPAAERNVLPLGIGVEDLPFRSLDRAPLAGRGMAELWRIRGSLARTDAMHAAISAELATRAAAPFSFLVVSLFAVAFGWSLRGRWTGRTPVIAWLAAPAIVAAAGILTQLYVHAHRVLLAFAVTSLSLTAAAIVLGALELVLVAAALAVLAGQSSA
jgi:hypothetical protein